jgi:hypothetical protein
MPTATLPTSDGPRNPAVASPFAGLVAVRSTGA